MGESTSRPPDVDAFIRRWTDRTGGAERANYALFLVELCDLIGVGSCLPITLLDRFAGFSVGTESRNRAVGYGAMSVQDYGRRRPCDSEAN